MQLIDGKRIAQEVHAETRVAVEALKAKGITPGLAVVLVGDDPASRAYVRSKDKMSKELGIHSLKHELPAETTQEALLALVRELNADPAIHGILVQLPLPKGLDEKQVLAAINPDKDVDGLHVVNAGRLASGMPALTPCTPLGCMILLRETIGDLTGLNAVVVGRSVLVGRPVADGH